MARPLVGITTQFGIESVAGTAVAANRFCQSLAFMPKKKRETKPFRPRGSKYPTVNVQHKKWGEGTYEGVWCYNGSVYVFSSLLPTVSAAAIGATAAWQRVFAPNVRQEESTRKTYTFEVGSSIAVDQYSYGQLCSLDSQLSQDDLPFSGNLMARYPTINQTQTASPTTILGIPVERDDITVTLDTAFGSIGTTPLTQVAGESISLGDKWKPFWAHGGTTTFDDYTEVAPDFTYSFITPHNSQSRALVASLDTEAISYLRIKMQGAQIATNVATPVYNLIQFDIAGNLEQADDDNEQDAFAQKFTFRALDDPGNLGSPFKVTCINLLATL